MNNVPMAVNPRTGAGVHGYGTFSAFQVVLNKREFSEREIHQVRTNVLLELPFALHGMTGTYTIDASCVVRIQIAERPKDVAGYNIGLPEMNDAVKHMKLDPDNGGYVNFTNAILEFNGYRVIQPPGDIKTSDHYHQILTACTRTLEPFFDWYSLATGNYSVTRVSPKDFVRFEAWHTLPPKESRWNHTFVHFPSSNLSFEAPETEGDMKLMREAIAHGKLGDEYSLAYRLYAEARRALSANDERLAAIQAISSLEVALSHYIESRIRENRDQLEELGLLKELRISMTGYHECERNLTLQIRLRLLFPLLVPKDVPFPKDEVNRCEGLRTNRNKAIHEPQKFDPSRVEEDLAAVGSLLKFLVAQEARSMREDEDTPG